MQECDFEALSRKLAPAMQRFVGDLHGMGIGLTAEISTSRPGDGLSMIIRKSGLTGDTDRGVFKLVNDGDDRRVRVECADTRVDAALSYEIATLVAELLVPDEFTRRMHVFVDEFLRRPDRGPTQMQCIMGIIFPPLRDSEYG